MNYHSKVIVKTHYSEEHSEAFYFFYVTMTGVEQGVPQEHGLPELVQQHCLKFKV